MEPKPPADADLKDFESGVESSKKLKKARSVREKLEDNVKSIISPATSQTSKNRTKRASVTKSADTATGTKKAKVGKSKQSPTKTTAVPEESESKYFQTPAVDMSDIKGLLMKFEGGDDTSDKVQQRSDDVTDSSDDADDWEEVEGRFPSLQCGSHESDQL